MALSPMPATGSKPVAAVVVSAGEEAAAATAAAATAAASATTTATDLRRPPKVVVIGAGFSGLSVAYHLLLAAGKGRRNGSGEDDSSADPATADADADAATPLLLPEVHILEARDRIGGRVHPFPLVAAAAAVPAPAVEEESSTTTTVSGDSSTPTLTPTTTTTTTTTVVDLGGQWVHEASERNPLFRLIVDDLGLSFVTFRGGASAKGSNVRNDSNVMFDEDGSKIPSDVVARANRIIDAALGGHHDDESDSDDESDDDESDDDPTASMRDLVDEQVRADLAKHGGGHNNNGHNNGPTSDNNVPLLLRTLNGLVHEVEEYEGGTLEEMATNEDWYVNLGGTDEVVSGTYQAVLDGIVARLEQATPDAAGEAGWRCSLRLNKKVTRIEHDPMDGDGGVIVTVVDLNDDDDAAAATTIRCDYCVCTVPLGVLQHPGAVEFVPPLPPKKQTAIATVGMGLLNKVVLQFDRPFWGDLKQFAITSSDPALVKTYYDSSEDFGADAILVQFLAGHAARRVDGGGGGGPDGGPNGGGLSDEEAVDDALGALRRVFGGDGEVPAPLASRVTRWREDEYSRGAYSFATVGSTAAMFDDLAEPVGNLLFAGEHTSMAAHSTVHGAWISGRREAERIRSRMAGGGRGGNDDEGGKEDDADAAAAARQQEATTD